MIMNSGHWGQQDVIVTGCIKHSMPFETEKH
jgi:hypothetical protein